MKETKDILVRGVPMELYEKLQKQTEKNMRSVNKEVIILIQKGVK